MKYFKKIKKKTRKNKMKYSRNNELINYSYIYAKKKKTVLPIKCFFFWKF